MIGRTVIVDSRPKEIVGVMPRGFRIVDADAEMIFPLAFDRARITLAGFNYQGVARLRPGVTIAQANADLARMLPAWMKSWPDVAGTDSRVYGAWKIGPAVRSLQEEVVGGVTERRGDGGVDFVFVSPEGVNEIEIDHELNAATDRAA